MSANVFSRDPIRIFVWRPEKGQWKHNSIVFCGRVPSGVKTEAEARARDFRAGKPLSESKILTHWYGRYWKKKLCLERERVFGGQDEEEVPEDIVPDVEETKQVIDIGEFITEEAPTEVKIVTAEHTLMWDVTMFPEDKISDLKYRINRYLQIPMFRQHLWYMHQGASFPMKYSISAAGSSPIQVDFWNQVINTKEKERIMGIPVQTYLYKMKDSLKIEAYDNFTLIGHLYQERGVTEYHVVDLESIVGPLRAEINRMPRNNRYQLSVLYYSFIVKYWPMINPSVWEEYIEKRDLKLAYPFLDPDELSYIDKQIALSNQLYDISENKPQELVALDKNIKKSLTSTTLKVSSTYRGRVVHFRVLFDLLECTESMDAIRLYDTHESYNIVIDKYWSKSTKSNVKMIPGVMYIRLVINKKPAQYLHLYLYPNASYTIESSWGEDMGLGFDDVNKLADLHVTPLIKEINKQAHQIMFFQRMWFPIMDKSNIKYVDISISIFWKQALSTEEFKQFKTVLDKFVAGHIMQEKANEKGTALTYYFKKGMFELDARRIEKLYQAADNYYAYLYNADFRQKWFILFENIRVTTITHRYSDVKIEISGIKEDEYYIFNRYIMLMLWLGQSMKPGKKGVSAEPATKLLSTLKTQDPKLFNLKKMYGSDQVYSKICQRPYQPELLSQKQFDSLGEKAKKSITKYHNFTTNAPAYYRCPNPKYPYIRFITGKHPMGYCIPCCKITPPSANKEDRQRKRHDQCLAEGKFERKQVEASSSRYIMGYGKSIDIGRLSNLPETTLEPLFSDTKSEDSSESPIEAKYYLYGVSQVWEGANVGYIHCLANALGFTIPELAIRTGQLMKANPKFFPLLVTGRAAMWFETADDLIKEIQMTFSAPNPKHIREIDWNALFIDIGKMYFDVNAVIFEDKNTVIHLYVPPGVITHADYAFPNHKHLIVLRNLQSGYWNPIYVIHKEVYFRTGIIETKLYDFQSDVVQLVMDMVRSKFRGRVQSENITLDIVRRFCDDKKHEIEKLMLTQDNMCYGVHIKNYGFFPTYLSYYRFDAAIHLGFSSRDISPPKLNAITRMVDSWNLWVAKKSQEAGYTKVDVPLSRPIMERVEPIYPFIEPEYWLKHGKVLGFVAAGMNWYVQPVTDSAALGEYKIPINDINYDPHEINKLLEARAPPAVDHRTETISPALYSTYLYKLMILQFINLFNKQKNIKVRNQIKLLIAKADFRTELLETQQKIIQIITNSTNIPQPDIDKINAQIADHMTTGDKKLLLKAFESDYYNFDRSVLEKLKTLGKPALIAQLKKLSEEIITPGTPTIHDFPNILSHCDGQEFCKSGKLIMSTHKIDEYLGILADQIKNPYVEKYLFSPLFATRIIDYFKFALKPNEHIEVEFV